MTYTPGPWKAEPYRGYKGEGEIEGWNVVGGDGPYPMDVAANGEYPYFCIRLEADAKLIAAAPDLLEAAKWFMQNVMESEDGHDNLLRATERFATAIAKAEGQ